MGRVRAKTIATFLDAEFMGENIMLHGVSPKSQPSWGTLAFSIDRIMRDPFCEDKADDMCLITSEFESDSGRWCPVCQIKHPNPKLAFVQAFNKFFAKEPKNQVGEGCHFGPGTVIGNAGFGFAYDEDGRAHRMPHIGGVIIGDRVEVGSNTVIDSGVLLPTTIGDDVKIDNLVHVAHNVHIGARTLVVAHAMIGGSAWIGMDCWIGAGALIRNKAYIGANVFVGMGANVVKDIEEDGVVVMGNPARVIRRRTSEDH